eukprot:scaffold216513_cov52-Prasinocladus_malaysianus.AAC.1
MPLTRNQIHVNLVCNYRNDWTPHKRLCSSLMAALPYLSSRWLSIKGPAGTNGRRIRPPLLPPCNSCKYETENSFTAPVTISSSRRASHEFSTNL